MAADPLDQVLRLVAEGRLTAEEAAPILAALDEQPAQGRRSGRSRRRRAARWLRLRPPARVRRSAKTPRAADPSTAPRSLRIEVRESGRQVVNVRLPLAVGRFALDRVPGLSGEQVDRVREALQSGFRGPVLVVDEGDSGVRIVLE